MVSCFPIQRPINPSSPSLLPPILPLAPKNTPNPPPSALCPTSNTTPRPLEPIDSPLSIPTQRALTLDRPPLFVLATPLSAVDTLLGEGIADGLGDAAFAELAADEVVDAVLEVVDLVDAGDFGFVELFWVGIRICLYLCVFGREREGVGEGMNVRLVA